MEVLGQEHGGVVSLSPHPTRPQSGFASLSGVGCVSLYDQRLRSRRYASITNTNIIAHTEAMELQFLSEHLVMAVSGPLIQVMDLRKQQLLHEYQHTSDVAQVLQEIPPPGASVTLFVDDDGHVIPFNTQSGCTTTAVEAHVFGTEMVLGGSYFGQLPNLCSGLGVVRCDARMDEEEDGTRGGGGTHHQCLVGLSMDSEGVVFRGVNPQDQLMFSVPDESAGVSAAVSGQLVNPPLANCCSFDGGNRMAVGRANGMYAIVELHPTEVLELLAAPGHGTNGLCHVGWCNHGRDLVTVSLCGDVSMWAITDFINTEPAANTNEEEEEEGELPELRLALSHRDVTMPSSIINTGVVVANSLALLVGDTNGFISRCSLEA